mmetsp:Transcript_11384/g.11411  ORF Transcript_11384/g.11411 Transcript_11384/m.11411 type:complete len:181 (+) Transcript_11384:148-690(+)
MGACKRIDYLATLPYSFEFDSVQRVSPISIHYNSSIPGGSNPSLGQYSKNTFDKRKYNMRQPWKPEEDEALLNAVGKHGAKNWNHIASLLPGRNAQQVRHRYTNYLQYRNNEQKNNLSKAFTEQEDQKILAVDLRDPAKWRKLGDEIGRPNHIVKNRYHWLKRRGKTSAADRVKISALLN